ncbi:TPA: KxYKxGKxW signal peptide domain-containing protein, partial [Streptococcus suis]
MYFNRKNSQQKNWRMIKKGKHFLFGCALVFAIGATANVASAETVVSDATADQTQQLTENSESASSETATSTTAVSEEATSTTATSEVASETVASSETASTTSEVATSATSTATSSEVASSETSTSATEVAASETSSTAAATSVANRTAYIGYEVQYTTSSGEVVGKTANIVAADTTEAVATATLTVSATDVPAGYELATEQAYSLTQQISENQINILSFAVVKKSEEEEIAASQLENKTPLLQAIAEAEALTSEATRLLATSQKENSSLAVAADATKAVTAEARTVLKDATASEEQVQATTATVQASSVSLGEELAKLSADGIVTAQLNSVTGLANVVDQYNITWDNQSVTGRNDAGFQLVTDANGKRILVYKYDLSNGTAFSMNDVLAQLNAIPKDANAGLRTLDGTEKSKLEGGTDGYSFSADTAKLNGQTIDFLDVVNLNPLWGGRPVVGATEGTNPNHSTFYVPGSTNIGTKSQEITVGGTNGTGTVTLSGTNELNFYSNQIDRQKLYIRSVAASYEGGTNSAVATDTDTDTIPVYMVGYKDLITVNSTATNVQINDGLVPNAIFIFGTNQGTTEDRDGATGTAPVADPTKATRKVAEFANIDADGSNATNATVATVAYSDLKNTKPDLASSDKTELTVTTDGYLTGKLNYGPGAKSSRRLDVTDSLGGTRDSDPFLVLGYTDKVADTTAVAKEFGVRPTTAEIYSKLAIDVNSSYPNAVPSTLVIPEDQYTREIVGYRTVSTSGTTETKGATTAATASTLPTSGTYEVRVKTTNIYGQEIYNWVRVQHEENEAPTVTVNST